MDWRGRADFGTAGDGGVGWCLSSTRRALAQWRGRAFATALEFSALQTYTTQETPWGIGPGAPYAWSGTLIHDKEDGVGTHYRRDRVLDPTTGRFTQEDPIGLAGRMNLYGFGGGDPVILSDPFGLCPDSLRTRNNRCPGDLAVDEWQAVERAAEQLRPGARTRVLEALHQGRIRGGDLGRDQAHVSGWRPDVIRVNRIFEREVSQFELDPQSLARIIAHEDRHVQQLANFGVLTQVLGGRPGFHRALETDADGWAAAKLVP